MPASVDRYLQPTLCWAANPLLQSNDGKTDRCTDTQPLHWPCSTYYAGSATHTHTHIRLTALCSGLPGVSRYQNGKTNLDFTEARDSEWQWAICKSAPRSRQITMPAPHHSVFYRPDALPAAQPTASMHWGSANKRLITCQVLMLISAISVASKATGNPDNPGSPERLKAFIMVLSATMTSCRHFQAFNAYSK